MSYVAHCDLDDKGFSASYPMTLQNLGQVAHHGSKLRQLVSRDRDMNKGAHRESHLGRIDQGAIAENNVAFLQAVNPLNDRRRGQSDSAPQLRERNARVGLELRQNFAIDVVKRRMN